MKLKTYDNAIEYLVEQIAEQIDRMIIEEIYGKRE